MRRTDGTAAPTAAALGAGRREVSALREVGLGAYEGEAFERARLGGDPLLLRAFTEERWDVLPGAEPMAEFSSRVWSGLCDVADAVDPGGEVLVFTHGGVIAELCRQVTGGRPFAFVGVDNASVTTLMLTGDGAWVLRGFNDTAHLP
jgi:probable phosphoglycerate mutase